MSFSDDLLDAGADIWAAQYEHPFVTELAAGELDEAAFRHWVEQDYRYLLDYARTFALAGTTAREEETMTTLLGVAHQTLDVEMDLHREFAADYGLSAADLEAVEKAPTCVAYTNFLVRTAHEGSPAEPAAAISPSSQVYLDVAEHMAHPAELVARVQLDERRVPVLIFREEVAATRDLVDDCAERWPGERERMCEAFLTSARLELAFWEMAYTQEGWPA
jgi:thiaminase/transcriptional activator TenA